MISDGDPPKCAHDFLIRTPRTFGELLICVTRNLCRPFDFIYNPFGHSTTDYPTFFKQVLAFDFTWGGVCGVCVVSIAEISVLSNRTGFVPSTASTQINTSRTSCYPRFRSLLRATCPLTTKNNLRDFTTSSLLAFFRREAKYQNTMSRSRDTGRTRSNLSCGCERTVSRSLCSQKLFWSTSPTRSQR